MTGGEEREVDHRASRVPGALQTCAQTTGREQPGTVHDQHVKATALGACWDSGPAGGRDSPVRRQVIVGGGARNGGIHRCFVDVGAARKRVHARTKLLACLTDGPSKRLDGMSADRQGLAHDQNRDLAQEVGAEQLGGNHRHPRTAYPAGSGRAQPAGWSASTGSWTSLSSRV